MYACYSVHAMQIRETPSLQFEGLTAEEVRQLQAEISQRNSITFGELKDSVAVHGVLMFFASFAPVGTGIGWVVGGYIAKKFVDTTAAIIKDYLRTRDVSPRAKVDILGPDGKVLRTITVEDAKKNSK